MDKSPQLNKNGGQVQRLTSVSPNLTAITQIAQSLGDDPVIELDADGLPNCRLSSVGISELTTNILRAVPNTKGAKFSVEQTRGQRQTGRNDLPGRMRELLNGW